ncbi:MAG: DsbA family protein [bacterium]|nr:DsbA family protein [bacterium]
MNVAVLLFLGYALLGSRGPLRMKIREYAAARETRMAAQDVFDRLASEGRVDPEQPTIIEFIDFQCPYCRDMHDVLSRGAAEGRFDVIVMHFPLDLIHPLAKRAAKASLCAEAQGFADDMNHLLLSTRNWMDDADWRRLASDAGIPDLKRFEECLDESETEQELASHLAIARDLGVRATPTFVSAGGVRSGVATLEELVQLAKN